ncbi:SusC/RagA family TonB-linked outer membrane protein [Catalinimonas alkaloidigena]|nr:SusC/RagA family TonB-linked outer membrane protein [Catalinimonas alkaloidigena]
MSTALPLHAQSLVMANAHPPTTSPLAQPDARSLRDELQVLERRFNITFTYVSDLLEGRKVQVHPRESNNVEVILKELLQETGLSYRKVDEHYYVIVRQTQPSTPHRYPHPQRQSFEEQLNLQQRPPAFALPVLHRPEARVSGRVVDASGEGVPGVNILEKGTSNGTISDVEGNFTLNVAENAVLVFSAVGYLAQEVAVGQQSVISVTLEDDVKALDEVVIVGYGNQERRNVTGAIATVKTAAIKDLPLTSADQKLSGQVAGVQVKQATGAPGGGVVIRVRGSGSIGAGDDPLYVIDGFPVTNNYSQFSNPLSTLNPDDIESITVLKDASSTAIYGSRGSNGVILITTKKAKAGISSIEFSSYVGLQQIPDRNKIKMMNAQQFAQWRVEHRQDMAAYQGVPFDPSTVPAEYQNPASLGAGTNWFEEMTRVAPMQNYNLTLTNGTEKWRTLVSAGYFNQQGTVLNSSFERYSLRVNFEGHPHERVTVGVNMNPSYTLRKIANTEGHFNSALLTQGLLNSPLPPVYQPDGSFTPTITSTDVFANSNPVNALVNTVNNQNSLRILSNIYADVEILTGLHLKSTFNVDLNADRSNYFLPSYVGSFRSPPPQLATGNVGSSQRLNWLNENTLSYDRTFGKHELSALVGYTIQNERMESNTTSGTGYPNDVVQTINAANQVTATADVQAWRLLSYLGRVNYSFQSKYILTAAIRSDGSSRFGPNNRWAAFPSIGAGWTLSQESFFPTNPWVGDLKLRASYGLAGNNSIGNYTYIPGIVSDNYVLGGGLANGFYLNSLSNANLGWESSKQLDIGLDVSFFNNRVSLVGEYYRRYTQSMLQQISIPSSSGYSSIISNIGNVLNRGVEITISSRNTPERAVKWDTDFNIAFNRNTVLDLGDREQIISGDVSTNISTVGNPMGMFYGYQFEGIFMNQQELDNSPHQSGQIVGTVKYRDVNGDGTISTLDRTQIGNPYPKFTFGLTNRVTFKNWDLSVLANGSYGAQIMDLYKRFTTNLDGVFNVEAEVMDRYRSPEQPGNGLLPTTVASTALAREVNSLWVKDASYVSVRNVTLGYTLTTKAISSIRAYLSVQNALMFSPYHGGWPEVSYNGSNSLAPGVNYTSYPVARTYTIGVNLRF